MTDDDRLIVLFREEQRLAGRRLTRGIAELMLAPVLVVVAGALGWVLGSLTLLLGFVVLALGSFVAGLAHVVTGTADLRSSSRELAAIAESRKLPEARLIER